MANEFTTRDLIINVLREESGPGTAGLLLETQPNQVAALTAAVTIFQRRCPEIEVLVRAPEIDVPALDRFALEVGRAVVGAQIHTLRDLPQTDRLIPFTRSFADGLQVADLEEIRESVAQASEGLNKASRQIRRRVLPELKKELGMKC